MSLTRYPVPQTARPQFRPSQILAQPATGTSAAAIVPDACNAVSTTSLALTAPTQVPLDACNAVSTTSLALSAPTQIPLNACNAVSATSLAVTAATRILLDPCNAISGDSLTVFTPGGVTVLERTKMGAGL